MYTASVLFSSADAGVLQATHFSTPSPPLHLSLSSHSLTLCVVWRLNHTLSLNFYDTRAVIASKVSG